MANNLKKQVRKTRKKVEVKQFISAEEKHFLDLLGGMISTQLINEVKL